ncbi:Csm2p KNAG_0E01740 [Huiozyma naganishii CBS 8797]|uniref:DNA recombination and repair protein Rad51-like C-terminal domain-containing protein n=1 Tax=Huiozyma naganishii (strain ATCC MYA-139 / BCRC 22969 / CBS 8797 / KCTC 17520 / NBRC 10181 / NCYC 3082 / Yp74L-3) TaxID=1071383 RepID=J7S7P1_HUIN7|nr:hypothetical protein KNAG_0E01740 [Kazachstania naganishii CBS 8797]CCK70436.1 hypothetical protein KNAG_0E01740 [Kazachstania naganishii CBS 8797]
MDPPLESTPLTVWRGPTRDTLAARISQFLLSDTNRELYYIDVTDSFPLQQFQERAPLNSHRAVYDHIKIIACLELRELLQSVLKITRASDQSTLVMINSIDTMFANAQYRDSQTCYDVLNEVLLELRWASSPQFTTVLVFPRNREQQPLKRRKTAAESLDEFIGNYYAERSEQM